MNMLLLAACLGGCPALEVVQPEAPLRLAQNIEEQNDTFANQSETAAGDAEPPKVVKRKRKRDQGNQISEDQRQQNEADCKKLFQPEQGLDNICNQYLEDLQRRNSGAH